MVFDIGDDALHCSLLFGWLICDVSGCNLIGCCSYALVFFTVFFSENLLRVGAMLNAVLGSAVNLAMFYRTVNGNCGIHF